MDPTSETETSPLNSRPLPNSSSVFLALACLTPPSPILIPSQIPTSYTSGDILIFLDSPNFDSPHCPESPGAIIQEAISQSFSTATVGTFGVRCRSFTQDSIPHPSESGVSISARSLCSVAADSPDHHNSPSPDIESDFRMSASLASSDTPVVPRSSRYNLASITRPRRNAPTDTTLAGDNTSNERNTYDDGSQTLPVLPKSSLYSPPPNDEVNIDMLVSCPDDPRVFGLDSSIPGDCLDRRPSLPAASMGLQEAINLHDPHLAHASRRTVDSSRPSRHSDSAALKLEPSLSCRTSPKFSFLPENLCWLKGIEIELLIDQEGFRSIQPSFRLAGYSSQSRSLSLDTSMDPGVAQFMPSRRQAFIFHYAPFDTPPVLRRLTVNGDESHDYISRQASLSIKSNGVYTVRGTEASSTSAHSMHSTSNHGSEVMKINWQFDYMVSDRRVDSTCKFTDGGERTFTPLTFSCSPALLNSLQGKKVRLMHVVRKSVVPKLVAEKMEPPKLPTAVPAHPLNIMEAITWSFGGIHKRAHSYVHRHAGNETRVGLNSSSWNTRIAKAKVQDSNAMVEPMRRRRASSAGEHSRVPAVKFPLQRIDGPGERASTSAMPLPHLSRHILPPSHLCALIAADLENQAPVAPRDHLCFRALSPRDYRPSTGTTRN